MNSKQEIELLKKEIEYYQKILQWYRDTYETRSIIGVVKEKINTKLKKKSKQNQVTKEITKPKFNTHLDYFEPPSIDKSSLYSTHHTDESVLKIGIFIHLFYQDLWLEIKSYLEKIGINFDLFITLNEADSCCEKTSLLIKKDYPKAIILKVSNKGLDVGPFFELTNYVIQKKLKYDYVLKIHTKKSIGVNAEIGEAWRKKTYESLLGSYNIVAHILRLFITDSKIGMIGPYETRMSQSLNDMEKGENANARNMVKVATKLQIIDKTLDFFGGTMFWVRWHIFEDKFKTNTLNIDYFEPGYKKDELLSHAMERLFASIIRDAGFRLYELNKINDYIYYKNKKKKICWVHPGFGIGGGNRVIFEICQEQMKYYDVYSISYSGHSFTNWMDVNHNVLSFSNETEAARFVETLEIDYIFATGWQTANFVNKVQQVRKKFYFVQDYEPWFANTDVEAAMKTYELNFNSNIVIANWLKSKLNLDHGASSKFLKLGTRFYNEEAIVPVSKKVKILFYFKLKSHIGRGSDLIYLLLKKLSTHSNIELHVFGHEDPSINGINFHGELHKKELISLYKNCDIYVDLSRHRGIATIALEVAQFGVVPLLSAETYGLKEYGFVNNVNFLFIRDIDDAYEKTLELAENKHQLDNLKKGVVALSTTFKWDLTVNDLNQIIDIL